MMCIYSITNLKNGKRYVGSTTNFEQRKKEHIKYLVNNCHHSIVLQRAFNKYKVDSFEFSILEIIELKTQLIEREQYYIDSKSEYNSNKIAGIPPLQSLKTLVTDTNGYKIDIYDSKILAFKSLNLKLSTKKFPFYFSNYLFFDANIGQNEIDEFVLKNRVKNRKLKPIYQFNENLELLKKWIDIKDIINEYGKAKFNCGITNAIKNKKRAFGYYWSYEKKINNRHNYIGHIKKKVHCYLNGVSYKIFDSITECAKEMNDQKINIIKVCKKEKKQSKGYYYEYM